ncbi:MAG: hypothetical protein ABIT10_11860 [Alteraurantiacibacter sp.]
MKRALLALIPLLSTGAMWAPTPGTPEEFAAAATACMEVQNGSAMESSKLRDRGFIQSEPPAELHGFVEIYQAPNTFIPITVDNRNNVCAVAWVAEIDDSNPDLSLRVYDSIKARVAQDFPNTQLGSTRIDGNRTTHSLFAGPIITSFMVDSEEGIVTFTFSALHATRLPPPSS